MVWLLILALIAGGPAPKPAEDDPDVAVRLAVAGYLADNDQVLYEWTRSTHGRFLFVGAVRADECNVGWTWHAGTWSGLETNCP